MQNIYTVWDKASVALNATSATFAVPGLALVSVSAYAPSGTPTAGFRLQGSVDGVVWADAEAVNVVALAAAINGVGTYKGGGSVPCFFPYPMGRVLAQAVTGGPLVFTVTVSVVGDD